MRSMALVLVLACLFTASAAARGIEAETLVEEIGFRRTAVFALGSFWKAEAAFGCLEGVVRTTAGYSGGSKLNPDYHSIGDHAEAVEVEYNPHVIAYEKLLKVFWANHDPAQVYGQGPDVGDQYRSIIFTQADNEHTLAESSKVKEQKKMKNVAIQTALQPLTVFYPAEAEHQKFELRRRPQLLRVLGSMAEEDYAHCRRATKLNGYAAGTCSKHMQKRVEAKLEPFLKTKPLRFSFN
eukprot:TRINITY_DN8607_c0_g1_i1.p1 TRINITY_DN8607_c0_g1~~TRINITY_DN8607_c0_g1_i1.p1  ORF type:complete len:238 (-),score=39.81 TRINITY_DN8607_c0_g1_i1:452-1165(-)